MIIFLNINLNVRNERKIVIELKGCTYKITHIVAANNPRLSRTLGTNFKLRHCTLLKSHHFMSGFSALNTSVHVIVQFLNKLSCTHVVLCKLCALSFSHYAFNLNLSLSASISYVINISLLFS